MPRHVNTQPFEDSPLPAGAQPLPAKAGTTYFKN
jgi:hypothetical protein